MDNIRSYRDLEAWQKAMTLAEQCYHVTERFPLSERFELTRQIRRAVVSIASNVAEGHNRRQPPVFVYHLRIALGSCAEFETQLELACRLKFLDRSSAAPLFELGVSVGQLLSGLIRSQRGRRSGTVA